MDLLDVIGGVKEGVQTVQDMKAQLQKEQSLLATLNPTQKRVLQEFFKPGFGIEQKGGCFSKKIEIKKMTDSEYVSLVMSAVDSMSVKKKALGKLGIDEDQVTEIQPVEFRAFKHTKDSLYKQRCSNLFEITWLFFSSTQLYAYSVIIDMLSNSLKERTEEYFYKDVTNFSSSTESTDKTEEVTEIKKGGCGKADQTIYSHKKTVLEVAEFKIVVPGDAFKCAMEANDEVEKRIQGMKQKLREKKS